MPPKKSRDRFPPTYYRFSDELCAYMDRNPDFLKSMKVNKPKRFVCFPMIITSSSPKHPEDQVIGIWYLDKQNYKDNKKPLFKQDFVVNKSKQNREFTSYAVEMFVNNNDVLPLNQFFSDYGDGGKFYHKGKAWEHNYDDVENLPDELQLLGTILKMIYHP